MSLQAIVTESELKELPVDLQAHYTKRDGKDDYILDVKASGNVELSDTGPLKRAVSSERERSAELERRARSVDENQLEALQRDNAKLTEQLKQHAFTVAADEAIAAGDFMPGARAFALPYLKERSKVVQLESGGFEARVTDDDGQERTVNRQGNIGPMTLSDLVREMREDLDNFGAMFKGSGTTGGGATGGSYGTTRAVHTISREAAEDHSTYRRAKAEAQEAGRELVITE